ncbi:MAG: hypothetical protein KatS3mg060_0523 [Dehalococcoidia bacterium]|nr:MAG: hypothetical protein KatS3mg060_0523 [Dehalococcoidia bacterium]
MSRSCAETVACAVAVVGAPGNPVAFRPRDGLPIAEPIAEADRWPQAAQSRITDPGSVWIGPNGGLPLFRDGKLVGGVGGLKGTGGETIACPASGRQVAHRGGKGAL